MKTLQIRMEDKELAAVLLSNGRLFVIQEAYGAMLVGADIQGVTVGLMRQINEYNRRKAARFDEITKELPDEAPTPWLGNDTAQQDAIAQFYRDIRALFAQEGGPN